MLKRDRHSDEREFSFTDKDFKSLRDIVYDRAGIVLKDHKRDMVYGRLARRLRPLGLSSFSEYLDYLNGPKGDTEIGNLINAITTNLTRFFRESHHFDHLKEIVIPHAVTAMRSGEQKRLRLWSAGCSSGEEPYTISMCMRDVIPKVDMLDAKILATDLDTNMLDTGRAGKYKSGEGISPSYMAKYCRELPDGGVQMQSKLQKLIAFKQLNLLGDWPMKGPFDAIFCRNVMIYFDAPTKNRLVERYASMLRPGGWLYVGHSESLLGKESSFKLEGRTIYRRK